MALRPWIRLCVYPILLCLLICSGYLRCDAQPREPSSPGPSQGDFSQGPPTEQSLPGSEISALKAIAAKLEIKGDIWNFDSNPCSWPGRKDGKSPAVHYELNCTCEATGICHVSRILLKSTNLTGELPNEEFLDLTHLTTIDLTRNYISGSIPTSWAKLPLVIISLLGNKLGGEIPREIGDITTLEQLVLENNLFEGSIPDSIGSLKNLKRLLLSANNFSGELPDSLGKLTNLTDFRIDGNDISGNFPSFIGNWTLLERLDMQGTSLEGSFPSTFSELTKVQQLRVTDFKGDGKFPPLETLNSSLKELILRNCSLSGLLPTYLGKFLLKTLDLSFNNFTRGIPVSFRELIEEGPLHYLFLNDNLLSGTIPTWNFGSNHIDFSHNNFLGPDQGVCQERDVNLVSSLQSRNNGTYCLRKNLPCFGRAKNSELFINCGGDSDIIVDGKKYEKDINSSGVSYFSDSSRNWAYSSNGYFVGHAKAPFRRINPYALKTSNPLYLSARTSASSLKYYGLCLQSGIYTVKLHFAEIIFTDDQTYASVGRRIFDVSIQGKIVLKDFNIVKEANGTGREIVMPFNASVPKGTLEIGFRWSGRGTNAIPARGDYGPLISAISVTPNFQPMIFSESKGDVISTGAIAGIVVGSLVAIFLIILILCYPLCKKKQENKELKQLKLQGTYFSLKQIKVATKNFDPENKIGEGGFGPVYKGALKGGFEVAVKQLSSKSKQGNREFVNEIGMISALQHPNLVKFLGCCIEGRQLFLVYEYLENNSLARALFGPESLMVKLDWQKRRKISLDIARGLAYLHEESGLKIIHRDIKATNILLDKNLDAKISDFGLAKLDDEQNTHISTRIAGTYGYMAPEYAMCGHLTEKADVYSYGVVLLEIVSGISNANFPPTQEFVYFLDRARALKDHGKLLDLVDPRMDSNFSVTEVEQMLNLALLCTNPSPTLRPTMTSVVSMIGEGIWNPL